MTHQIFAATPSTENTEKPTEKVAPISDQPSPAPIRAPADPAPALRL